MGKDSDILRLLESKKGTIVSHEEITRHVWPELLESNLAKQVIDEAIERIRAQIEDDPLDPLHLITIGDAGFLLI